MILNDIALRQRAIEGLVSPLTLSNVQASSIDPTLGNTIKVEAPVGTGGDWFEVDLTEQGYALDPGEFILAHTMPRQSPFRKTVAPWSCCVPLQLAAGYEHSLAGWCDPGFGLGNPSQITLELRNNLRYRHLPVSAGMRLCQLVVHKLEAVPEQLYGVRGSYQGQIGVTASNINFTREAALSHATHSLDELSQVRQPPDQGHSQ